MHCTYLKTSFAMCVCTDTEMSRLCKDPLVSFLNMNYSQYTISCTEQLGLLFGFLA